MTVFLFILAAIGWIIAIALFAMLGIISQIYVAQKNQIMALLEVNERYKNGLENKEVDWNQWIPPYE